MARIPDALLMKPEQVARQIESAYREGVADQTMDKHGDADVLWETAIAKGFAGHYLRIGLAQEKTP
jgi:hypothetical protein